ncbi:DNA repair helicase XPB [Parasphaerochaeta coccoides]|uniref:DNA 3'-5' helicase n=1 Tax=Parasphaerochaeta coccoides (strain ATCC BAA-1237 / DSM 17374 / SPN1) TaxID=760011 RepID=F4GKZ8_PARC1|nr:DNA repair helicase XPB [Parasphaerochaeta coccoides]AEC01911.1 helicase domain protein [Parasphaerochaeta coccoides DSM 17374]
MSTDKPLVIQSDKTLLLDVHSPFAQECRDSITAFSELVKSPEHVHTFLLTPLSLWNANAAGMTTEDIMGRLRTWSRYDIPEPVSYFITDISARFGSFVMTDIPDDADHYLLTVTIPRYAKEISSHKTVSSLLFPRGNDTFLLNRYARGEVKLKLIKLGFPVDDRIPLKKGFPVPMNLRQQTLSGKDFSIRDYQEAAARSLLGDRGPGTGYGTIVLPCGAGKTIVGMDVMSLLQIRTLILTTNVSAVHQWIREILDKMDIPPEDVGEYTGAKKEIKPVTVCTYQVVTWRPDKEGVFPHMSLLREGNWGLIIYDEVHMLPAPVFKVTAELQAVHRVGLTATLIREDGREDEVFSLVGPKRFDVPWSEMEKQGWIARAYCIEVKVPLPHDLELTYAIAGKREKHRVASENPIKMDVLDELLSRHADDYILIIGQYVDQLKQIARKYGFPLITGSTANTRRDDLYAAFRSGGERVLVVSKVANFAIDLPDASIAIQVSGTFGSRQEEAQRLGRILRPKAKSSFFYSLVTRYSSEEEFSENRQKFLAEQGYTYKIEAYEQ